MNTSINPKDGTWNTKTKPYSGNKVIALEMYTVCEFCGCGTIKTETNPFGITITRCKNCGIHDAKGKPKYTIHELAYWHNPSSNWFVFNKDENKFLDIDNERIIAWKHIDSDNKQN